jgi:hypothetical protein
LPPTNLSCKKRVFVRNLFTSGSASILVLQFTSAIRKVHGIISIVCIIEAFFAHAWGRAAADDGAVSSNPARLSVPAAITAVEHSLAFIMVA